MGTCKSIITHDFAIRNKRSKKMNNAEVFKSVFGVWATEIWALPESEFLQWLSSPHLPPDDTDCDCAIEVSPETIEMILNASKAYWEEALLRYDMEVQERKIELKMKIEELKKEIESYPTETVNFPPPVYKDF